MKPTQPSEEVQETVLHGLQSCPDDVEPAGIQRGSAGWLDISSRSPTLTNVRRSTYTYTGVLRLVFRTHPVASELIFKDI
jgi:hypothetical protein